MLLNVGKRQSTRMREQYSEVTHWLDASFLYGSSQETNSVIRNSFQGQLSFLDIQTGVLNYQKSHVTKQILPPLTQHLDGLFSCPMTLEAKLTGCFLAGDERVNQQPLSAALHILLLRFHNSLASVMASSLPTSQVGQPDVDEQIFQTVRKVVISVYQNIVYREFLPVLLGSPVAENALYKMAGLQLFDYGFFTDYDAKVNPNVYNEFTSAAFRLVLTYEENISGLSTGPVYAFVYGWGRWINPDSDDVR